MKLIGGQLGAGELRGLIPRDRDDGEAPDALQGLRALADHFQAGTYVLRAQHRGRELVQSARILGDRVRGRLRPAQGRRELACDEGDSKEDDQLEQLGRAAHGKRADRRDEVIVIEKEGGKASREERDRVPSGRRATAREAGKTLTARRPSRRRRPPKRRRSPRWSRSRLRSQPGTAPFGASQCTGVYDPAHAGPVREACAEKLLVQPDLEPGFADLARFQTEVKDRRIAAGAPSRL